MSKWNFEYQYRPFAPVVCQHRILEKKDSLVVFFKLTFDPLYAVEKNIAKKYNWKFNFRITQAYESKKSYLDGTIDCKRFQIAPNEFLFFFPIQKIDLEGSVYMFIEYFNDEKGKPYIHDIPLKVIEKELFYDNLLFETNGLVPVFDNYFHKNDTVVVKSGLENDKSALFYYRYNFPAAMPPQTESSMSDGDIKLRPDTIFSVLNDTLFSVNKKGVVFLNSNIKKKGVYYYTCENKFPKVTKTKELIDPILYISTNDESRSMKASAKPKVKLDEFWLNMLGERDLARKVIKAYYTNVQNANKFFTDYKEGWKTDRGIIYTVFGPPNEVYKLDFKETWKYKATNQLPAFTFIFTKRTDAFGNYFFEIQNSDEYTNLWFTAVEIWRKGMLEE